MMLPMVLGDQVVLEDQVVLGDVIQAPHIYTNALSQLLNPEFKIL